MDTGKIIKCMDKELWIGLMGVIMKVAFIKIKNMAMVDLNGLMAEFMKVNGRIIFKMEKAGIKIDKMNGFKEHGKREKKLHDQIVLFHYLSI